MNRLMFEMILSKHARHANSFVLFSNGESAYFSASPNRLPIRMQNPQNVSNGKRSFAVILCELWIKGRISLMNKMNGSNEENL